MARAGAGCPIGGGSGGLWLLASGCPVRPRALLPVTDPYLKRLLSSPRAVRVLRRRSATGHAAQLPVEHQHAFGLRTTEAKRSCLGCAYCCPERKASVWCATEAGFGHGEGVYGVLDGSDGSPDARPGARPAHPAPGIPVSGSATRLLSPRHVTSSREDQNVARIVPQTLEEASFPELQAGAGHTIGQGLLQAQHSDSSDAQNPVHVSQSNERCSKQKPSDRQRRDFTKPTVLVPAKGAPYCYGCGAILQSTNSEAAGFVSPAVYEQVRQVQSSK